MGGGGDVVGALGITPLIEELQAEGADGWVLGGVAWERTPIDPRPGPRSLQEIKGGEPCGSTGVLADAETISADGVHFSESRMAEHLGTPVLLLDITRGPSALAKGLGEAASQLGCDLVMVLDVGGDVLANGHEPGLASPLCDSIVLAAAAILALSGKGDGQPIDVIGAVYGPGCDGELTPAEVLGRIEGLERNGAMLGTWPLSDSGCDLVESAARE